MLRTIMRSNTPVSVPRPGGATQLVRFLWKRIHLPAAPLVLVLMLEALSRTSFAETYQWMIDYPNEFWLNYWIALFLTLVVTGFAGRTRRSYAVLFGLFGALGFLSGMKANLTGAPLYIWDLFLPQTGTDTVRSLNSPLTRNLLWVAAAAAGTVAGAVLLPSVRLGWRERLVYAGAGLFLLGSVYLNSPIAFWDDFRITPVRYEQVYNCNRNGILVAAFDALDFVLPEKPAGSGSIGIRKLVRELEGQQQATGGEAFGSAVTPASFTNQASGSVAPAATDKAAAGGSPGNSQTTGARGGTKDQPNVIVLLSETFWDPTLMKNVSFSSDPLPFFRSLMQRTTGGWMLTPQFGGTTANVEFEVLTGNSVRFIPNNSIAYINYLNRNVDSLASIFARQGYATTAINPFFNWFFNSRNAYRNMGFSRFISSEFFEPKFHGPNYEDAQVMSKIIESADGTPGPDFIFANTMENHGSYEDKFYDHPITVSGSVSAKTKNMLENYATGELAFDKAFQTLVEHYERSGEPTVILCFGDHLPAFGSNYYGFKDAGYITGNDDPQFMEKMHYTPFVLWDNTTGRPREELRMNASFLGPYLLHYTGKPGTYYTDYLYGLYQKQPIIPIRPFRKQHPMDESLLADYKRFQYDILFGNQTGYQEAGIAHRIAADRYTLGYGNPELTRAESGPKGRIDVYGGPFSSESTVWLNGRKLQTTSWEAGKLTAWLPDGAAQPALPWTLQVRTMDLKGTAIVQSAKLVLDEIPPPAAAKTP
ncbi:LTA synthase family protein [Gorillibacterium sp. sgz5001074]|uniref:LTA synthase family protein n=1 Tax=Gorillibacterium sp. sgz5001074 TaxID=3446695 RepID=UPI003F6782FB